MWYVKVYFLSLAIFWEESEHDLCVKANYPVSNLHLHMFVGFGYLTFYNTTEFQLL